MRGPVYGVLDVMLAVCAAAGLAAAVMLLRRAHAVAATWGAIAVGLFGFGLVVGRTVDDPLEVIVDVDVGAGPVVAAAALAVIAAGGIVAAVAGREQPARS